MTQDWLGWASFPAGRRGRAGGAGACWGPGFPLCSSEGWKRGQVSSCPSGRSLRPRPSLLPPPLLLLHLLPLCPGVFPPWPPISCFLGFPSGRLPALPKTPTRKFACCHEIMQMSSCGCPGNSSPDSAEYARPVPLGALSPATHRAGQTPSSPTDSSSDKCRDTKEGSE